MTNDMADSIIGYGEYIANRINQYTKWVDQEIKNKENMAEYRHLTSEELLNSRDNFMTHLYAAINAPDKCATLIPTPSIQLTEPCVSIGKKEKTFSLGKVINIINSMSVKEFDEDWESFGSVTPNTDQWIRKQELIEKFKKA